MPSPLMPSPFGTPAAPRRRLKVGKRLTIVMHQFASLPREHKKRGVLLYGARCAGISEETMLRHASLALSLIEGSNG